MTAQRQHPGGSVAGPGYAEISTFSGAMAHVAGQCPLDDAGSLVGSGDLVVQTEQVVAHLRTRLDELGAGPQSVLRTTVYVVGDQEALATAWSVFRASGVSGTPMAPSTLLGVARLGYAGQLVEIDAVVALDGAAAGGG